MREARVGPIGLIAGINSTVSPTGVTSPAKVKAILDGDFTRLNTYASDAEKEFVISLQLLAGGPIAASDRPTTIGDNLRFYTNIEMLALNTDRFVGHPLDKTLNSQGSNIWHGTMTDGSHIVGFFNREDEPKEFSLHLSETRSFRRIQGT
ncbi:MAG: hypothetical protein ACLSHL_09440 [Alistipes communis]